MKPKRYEYKGKLYSIGDLYRLPECTVSRSVLSNRIQQYGWSVEDALRPSPYAGVDDATQIEKNASGLTSDKIKQIMSIPVDPKKTQYYYMPQFNIETKYKLGVIRPPQSF